jgi:hypothetical protein
MLNTSTTHLLEALNQLNWLTPGPIWPIFKTPIMINLNLVVEFCSDLKKRYVKNYMLVSPCKDLLASEFTKQ